MNTQRVKRYRKPAYPTRLEVLSRPELLQCNLPRGWHALPEMAGTVALFLAVNSTLQAADKKPVGAAAVVAPIFEHGEGRGATGCIVIAPPVFLSEEEAWQVIDEELAKQGVKVPGKEFEVRGVKIAARMESYEAKNGDFKSKMEDMPGSAKPYKADRADPQKRIAVEFVSASDYHRLGGPFSMSSVQSYDFKEVGKSVAEHVRKEAKDKVYFGVLYDPSTAPKREDQPKRPEDWKTHWEQRQTKGKAESQRLLRLQVQDFVRWLQGQGAI